MIRLRKVTAEDRVIYRLPSMVLYCCFCDFRCWPDKDNNPCANAPYGKYPIVDVSFDRILRSYKKRESTRAIAIAGFEPLAQFEEVKNLIEFLRNGGVPDDVVIYTGYYPGEIKEQLDELRRFGNVVVKFGPFVPGLEGRYDEVLGVTLPSGNQYAERIN